MQQLQIMMKEERPRWPLIRAYLTMIFLLLLSITIRIFSSYLLQFAALLIRTFFNLLQHIADLLISKVWLLVFWSTILGLTKHLSLTQLIVRAVTPLLVQSEEVCSICLGDKCDTVLMCGHVYHWKCVEQWENYQRVCPYCRSPIRLKKREELTMAMVMMFVQRHKVKSVLMGIIALWTVFVF